jgi:hypothetical protein
VICGILHGDGYGAPDDKDGCILPVNHTGQPHEFVANDGTVYQWETDLECECDHCMRAEGDFCTTYWKKDQTNG